MGRAGMEGRVLRSRLTPSRIRSHPSPCGSNRDGCELLADPGLSPHGYFCSQPVLTHIFSATDHTNTMLRPGLSWAGFSWAGPSVRVGQSTPSPGLLFQQTTGDGKGKASAEASLGSGEHSQEDLPAQASAGMGEFQRNIPCSRTDATAQNWPRLC